MRLIFDDMDGIRRLIAHAMAAKDFRRILGEESASPALHFVKDEGIYLMSNGSPRDIIGPARDSDLGRSFVVYAKGFNPTADPDVWERSREAVGGDDFVESFPIAELGPISLDVRALFIDVTDDGYAVGVVKQKAIPTC
jgi:DUF3085 family protein